MQDNSNVSNRLKKIVKIKRNRSCAITNRIKFDEDEKKTNSERNICKHSINASKFKTSA